MMKFRMLKFSFIGCVLASAALITGCSQTAPEDERSSSKNKNTSAQFMMLNTQPEFKQTTLDEIKYVTTFSSWAEASEKLGVDLAPCGEDKHAVNYHVLPNYSILQTSFDLGNITPDNDQPDGILQADGGLIGDTSDLTGGVLQAGYGEISEASPDDQSGGVESVTVFLPNSKNQDIDSTNGTVKLSDRVSVSDDVLYSYYNDFCSISPSPKVQWEYIDTVHIDSLGVEADFCATDFEQLLDADDGSGTTGLKQLFAFMVYDGCFFEVSYGIMDESNFQAVIDSVSK